MTTKTKELILNSLFAHKASDPTTREKNIQHVKSQLKSHENGLKFIGIGFADDFVTAGRIFLRIIERKGASYG